MRHRLPDREPSRGALAGALFLAASAVICSFTYAQTATNSATHRSIEPTACRSEIERLKPVASFDVEQVPERWWRTYKSYQPTGVAQHEVDLNNDGKSEAVALVEGLGARSYQYMHSILLIAPGPAPSSKQQSVWDTFHAKPELVKTIRFRFHPSDPVFGTLTNFAMPNLSVAWAYLATLDGKPVLRIRAADARYTIDHGYAKRAEGAEPWDDWILVVSFNPDWSANLICAKPAAPIFDWKRLGG